MISIEKLHQYENMRLSSLLKQTTDCCKEIDKIAAPGKAKATGKPEPNAKAIVKIINGLKTKVP